MLDTATDSLSRIRERAIVRNWHPRILALIGTAELELGNLETGRAAAQEGVDLVREFEGYWNPHCYAVLARAQLALAESDADITSTLDEYAALLARTKFHIYEGELHELRARLAEREGQQIERAAALLEREFCGPIRKI